MSCIFIISTSGTILCSAQKIQHFLGLTNSANHGGRNATATHNHRHGVNGLFQLAHPDRPAPVYRPRQVSAHKALNRGCMARCQ